MGDERDVGAKLRMMGIDPDHALDRMLETEYCGEWVLLEEAI